MNALEFENRRWVRGGYGMLFRHRAAAGLVVRGPVLDVGCGDGTLLAFLRSGGVRGTGTDFSEVAVHAARGRGVDARLHDAVKDPLPFRDRSFGTVVLLDVLEHLYDPDALLREAVRVSSRDVIVGVPNFNSFVARFQALFGRVPENNTPQKGHVYWFNRRILIGMARNSGLRPVAIRTNTVMERYSGIGFLPRLLVRIFPDFFALSFVIRFEKSAI